MPNPPSSPLERLPPQIRSRLRDQAARVQPLVRKAWRWAVGREQEKALRTQQVRDICQSYLLMAELGTHPGVAEVRSPLVGDHALTVSLTTIPSRIGMVHLTIESLFRQSLAPDRVVLWLDRPAFDEGSLTPVLRHQCERGLEVRFCEDLRSYKKLIPALEAYPDDLIVTVDDDVIYPRDWLEGLVRTWAAHPQDIAFHRGRRITVEDGRLAPYDDWTLCRGVGRDPLALPTGVGGVLYYPGCFHPDVHDVEAFRRLCPKADDLWFRIMALRNGVAPRQVESFVTVDGADLYRSILTIPTSQDESLFSTNVSGNDPQLAALIAHYGLEDELGLR